MKKSSKNQGLLIGEYKEDYLSALVKIVNANYMDYPDFFYEFIPYTQETLRSKIESRPIVYVARNHAIEGFIICYIASWGTTIDMLCVAKSPKRTKIENMLISKVEKGAKGWKVVIFLSSDSPHISHFEKKGYEIYGGLYHMVIKLDHFYPIPKVPEGVTFRSMTEKDTETVIKAFYNPEDVGSSIFKPGFTREWKENWNLVAELEDKIIAVICTRPENEYNKYYNTNRAEIWGPNVLPNYRKKGLGKALTCKALNLLKEKGIEEAAFDATEKCWLLDHRRKLGFKAKKHRKFLRKYL